MAPAAAVMAGDSLPATVDVVVVGSGAAGLATACCAAAMGLKVAVLESDGAFGGTTALSGAAIWIPFNRQARAEGIEDSRAAVLGYLQRLAGDDADPVLIEAFVDHAAEALAFLEDHTPLRYILRKVAPDYHQEVDGASLTGRALDVAEFDGRALGDRFAQLRALLDTHLLFGGMMVNRADVQALLRFGRETGATVHVLRLLLRHAADRMRGPRGTRLVIGSALVARLAAGVFARGVPVFLRTPVIRLLTDQGAVRGVICTRPDGHEHRVVARLGVVLATGGFAHDTTRTSAEGTTADRHFSMAAPSATGSGIRLALEVGGTLAPPGDASAFFLCPVSLRKHRDGRASRFAHLTLDRAKPGIIAIDSSGRRFTNEAASYHRFGTALQGLDRADGPAAWLICDARALRRYGLGLARPAPAHWGNGRLISDGYLIRAPTLAGLAQRIGVPERTLADTVLRHNGFAESGIDADFGKGACAHNRSLGDPAIGPNPCLASVVRPPFHAVGVYGGDLGTARGLRTDARARVLDAGNLPVSGLYAVGNDMNSVMAGTYPGAGITLGPALTFAYLAARHMASAAPPGKDQP